MRKYIALTILGALLFFIVGTAIGKPKPKYKDIPLPTIKQSPPSPFNKVDEGRYVKWLNQRKYIL